MWPVLSVLRVACLALAALFTFAASVVANQREKASHTSRWSAFTLLVVEVWAVAMAAIFVTAAAFFPTVLIG